MSTDTPEDWKPAYYDALYRRREEARRVQQREVVFQDGSHPERNRCHVNAARFVAENPGFTVVCGWLRTCIWDFQVMFDAHSLVADEAGQLIEITPMVDGMSLPFLQHTGSEEQFVDFIEGRPSQLILWPPGFDPRLAQPVLEEDDTTAFP